MRLIAHLDYRLIDRWEVDAGEVLEQNWRTLLPDVLILRGGDDQVTIGKALVLLRGDEQLAEMEFLLAFYATFVLTPEELGKMMMWNMAMLREFTLVQ